MAENTPETYADLLKARGDVPISVIRQLHARLGDLLTLVDTVDEVFEIPPAPTKAEAAIAAALRARYPDFKDQSDAEVLAYFGVKVVDDGN